ncbi:MAG: hypothetical protein Q8O55_07595 [Dehalococcoidales bacterium]|nr:hypothetical protein [Dehalococcoidales bacterium]
MPLRGNIEALYNAILNGPAVQITRYPANAVGSTVTGSGMTTGAYKYAAAGANQVQIVAAVLNTAGVWIAGAALAALSIFATETAVLWIGRGTIPAAVRAAEFNFTSQQVTAVGQIDYTTQFLPIPLFVRAGIALAADLANSSANDITATAAVFLYTGLGN